MRKHHLFLSRTRLLLLIFLLSSLFAGQIAFAGNGDGTGGNSNDPLSLISSSIKDGATGVPLKPEITLVFSKNIVNMAVKDNNLKCFSMKNENGTIVPIDVIFADDQVDFADRDNAVITPKTNLTQGTNYTIVVSSQLESKSGTRVGGNGITISFTTEGTKPVSSTSSSPVTTPKANTSAPTATTNTGTTNTATAATKTAVSTKSNTNTASSTEEKPSTVQASTNAQTKTAENKTNTEKQINGKSQANAPADSKVKAKKTKKNKEADSKSELKKAQTGHSNTAIITTVISLLVIIAAVAVYLYKRRKPKK